MNHKAIFALYPQAVTVDDGTGAFDKDGNSIAVDETLVNKWVDPEAYTAKRQSEYPAIGDQLDALWKGGDAAAEMLAKVQAVKAKYPKGATE
jgi:hypothetical protein